MSLHSGASRGREGCAAKPGACTLWGLHHPQAHKGLPRNLWSPWGHSDNFWIQGAALGSLHPITLSISQGTGGFHFLVELSELQLSQWNLPTPTLRAPPGHVDEVCSSLRAPSASLPGAGGQQLPAND